MNAIIQKKWIIALCAIIMTAAVVAATLPLAAYAAENPLRFTVKQVFTASPAPDDTTFTYRLKPLKTGIPMPSESTSEGYTFTIKGNESVQIGPLDFSKESICRYELFQVIGTEKPGYTYDKRVYTIEVYTSPTQGSEIILKNEDGTKSDNIEFENRYDVLPSDPKLMTDPAVKKTVSGSPRQDSTFTFKLAAKDPSWPMPAGSENGVKTITIKGSGKGEFGTWSYTQAGTYYYTVYEVNAGEQGYTYDAVIYTITDTVKPENGRLVLSRVVTNDSGKQVTTLSFINTYASKAAGVEGPKTGDDMNLTLYTALLVICGAVAAGMAVYLIVRRKTKAAKADGRKKNPLIAVIALIIGIGVAVFAGSQLIGAEQVYREASAAYDALRGQVKENAETGGRTGQTPLVHIPPVNIDFDALALINDDSVAWLYSPGTVIDYPVMKAEDYSYYLSHLPDGTYNANGTLFIDYNCAPDFSDRLTVIYGHHMQSGRMFASINGYKAQDYYDEHPFMYLYTKQGNYRIDLLYGCVVGAGQWRERAFMYEENTDALLAYAAHSTTFASDAEYEEGDRIVALSTCSYEFDNARYVVIGVLRPEY